jgi:hypothetical protein
VPNFSFSHSHRTLREISDSEDPLIGLVLSSLTIGASSLIRELIGEVEEHVTCPAHDVMELIKFGSDRHSHLLDNVFKIRNQKKISCRNCSRNSISNDLKFYFCPSCQFVRCIFCNSHPTIAWPTVRAVIEACPGVVAKPYPGNRLILHEIAAREGSAEATKTCLSIYASSATITDTQGDLPLHWACASGSTLETIQLLIESYPDSVRLVNQAGKLPLHLAVERGKEDIVEYLLTRHPSSCSITDALGWLPLHYAVSALPHPVEPILRALLKTYPMGCEKPNTQGLFPLHLYVRNRPKPAPWVVQILLDCFPFAAFVTTGQDDELPLHVVVSRDPPPLECVRALVSANPEGGLQLSAKTAWADPESPLSIALRRATSSSDISRGQDRGGEPRTPSEWYWQVREICSSLRFP